MEETIYLLGSLSALLLLLGHTGWLLARLLRRAAQGRPEVQRADPNPELAQELSRQLEALRAEIGSAIEDVHERLDFAERVLAKGRGAQHEEERQ